MLPAARARLSGAHVDDGGVGRVLAGVELDDLDLDAEGAPPLMVVRGPQGRQVVANDWIIFVGSRRRVREWGEEVCFRNVNRVVSKSGKRTRNEKQNSD